MKFFSSGPTYKGSHWQVDKLQKALLSRSHRAPECLSRINYLQSLLRDRLSIPTNYHIGLVNGSCTGAMECIVWNLLGFNNLTSLLWDNFAKEWSDDATKLGVSNKGQVYDILSEDMQKVFSSQHAALDDILFTWTSTLSGLKPSSQEFLETTGLKVCDAAAVAFVEQLPWQKLDAVGFSLQKGLGSEAGLGVVVFSPAAYERVGLMSDIIKNRAVPRLFRLNQQNIEAFFSGHTLNTISMLLIEDAIIQLEQIQDMQKHYLKAEQNKQAVYEFVQKSEILETLLPYELQSNSTFCFKLKGDCDWDIVKNLAIAVGLDSVIGHPKFVPCWRLWTGPLIETADLLHALQSLEKAALLYENA